MPELAAAYVVGFVANLVFMTIILVRAHRSNDQNFKAHAILGGLCTVLSWPGLFFFILIEGSLIYIARRGRHSTE